MKPERLALRRLGTALLDQQLWCWGQDVLHEENLLLRFGFTRYPPPLRHKDVPSIYQWSGSQYQVLLRGFGIGFGDPEHGRIFLRRFDFVPRLLESKTNWLCTWAADSVAGLSVPRRAVERRRAWMLVAACAGWIANYEEWVLRSLGSEYRRHCLKDWRRPGRRSFAPTIVPRAWRTLADSVTARLAARTQ